MNDTHIINHMKCHSTDNFNIIQIDGNTSLPEENSVNLGHPPDSKKVSTAQSLPKIMVANNRSVFPKFQHLIDELIECDVQVGIHTEIWESNENNEHKNKIEEALEIHGIVYISNPRPKRRGGGAAITLSDPKHHFSLC